MTISVRRIPKDHTSDLILNVPKLMASGAVHLMGNLAPNCQLKNAEEMVLLSREMQRYVGVYIFLSHN